MPLDYGLRDVYSTTPLFDLDALFSKAPNRLLKYKKVFQAFIAEDTDILASFRLLHPSAVERFVDHVISSDKKVGDITRKQRIELFTLFTNAVVDTL